MVGSFGVAFTSSDVSAAVGYKGLAAERLAPMLTLQPSVDYAKVRYVDPQHQDYIHLVDVYGMLISAGVFRAKWRSPVRNYVGLLKATSFS